MDQGIAPDVEVDKDNTFVDAGNDTSILAINFALARLVLLVLPLLLLTTAFTKMSLREEVSR